MKTIFFPQAKTLAVAALSLIFAVGVSAAPTVISTNYVISGGSEQGFIVTSGVDVQITLNAAAIEPDSTPAIEIQSGATVRLILTKHSILRGGANGGHAAIKVASGATLTIDGDGSLTASGRGSSAGIGSNNSSNCGKITFLGGTIQATGGVGAAGIGGGQGGSGGQITIEGGIIRATGGDNNVVDIGSGQGGSGEQVVITGGNVNARIATATNALGQRVLPVKMQYQRYLPNPQVAEFSIPNSITTAVYGLRPVSFDADNNLFVWLPAGNYAAGTINLTFYINNTNIEETEVFYLSNQNDLLLDNANTTTCPLNEDRRPFWDDSRDNVVISETGLTYRFAGKLNFGITVAQGKSVNIIFDHVSINLQNLHINDWYGALDLKEGATVNLTIKGENTLVGGANGPGIAVPEHATLIIGGNGKLTAIGGFEGAGIGSGQYLGRIHTGAGGQFFAYANTSGTVIINSGHIIAKGGEYACGIGAGGRGSEEAPGDTINFGHYINANGTVIINGGMVEASSDNTDMRNGVGIGGVRGGSDGTIIINGGSVRGNSNTGELHVDSIGRTVYPIDIEFISKGSNPSLAGHTFFFKDKKYEYDLNSITTDGNPRLWLPVDTFFPRQMVIKNKEGEPVFINTQLFRIPGATNVFRFAAYGDVLYELSGDDKLGIQASFINESEPFESGKILIRDDIRVDITGTGDNVYLYRWEYLINDGDLVIEYTEVPYKIFQVNALNISLLNVKCKVFPCYPFSYTLKAGNVTLLPRLRDHKFINRGDSLHKDLYAPLGDEITLAIAESAGQYEHSLTVNGQLQGIGLAPIMHTEIVSGPINAEYSAKRMVPISFPETFTLDDVTFKVDGKYEGNTYAALGAGNVFHTEPLAVKSGESVALNGNLILTITPDKNDDERVYKYIYGENNEETFHNEIKIDSVQDDLTEISAEGPYYFVTLSLLGAPSGTTLVARHGNFSDTITANYDWEDVSNTSLVFSASDLLTLKAEMLQQEGSKYQYKWNGEFSTENVYSRPFTIDRTTNITCEILSQNTIAFALSEEIPGLELIATYDDTPIESGDLVWMGGKFSITMSGDSAHLYRYASWTWTDTVNTYLHSSGDTISIEHVRGKVDLTCTPYKMGESVLLESLIVNTGYERINVLDGGIIKPITVGEHVLQVMIEATAPKGDNSTILGNEIYDLVIGKNTIMITVISENGKMEKQYWLTIFREYSNRCGNNVFWEPRGDTLVISGSGRMYDNLTAEEYPWYLFAGAFKVIVLEEGVDFIGDGAFVMISRLTEVINRNTNPQEITILTFYPALQGAKLYVPAGTEQTYKADAVWQKFNVIGLPGLTGIAPLNSSPARVYAEGQILYIDTPEAEQITVYSLTGNLLHRFEKPVGVSNFRVASSGIVIVKGSSGWVRKVVGN
ncbi:MAG: carbohydrate-binding domain-containing protein [Dysgonamonadaceae bacterium]|jgi:hypothetical protein|nr:carbohydrate-binding domain-containing protein [Dysgonamonadaceae bacterium]